MPKPQPAEMDRLNNASALVIDAIPDNLRVPEVLAVLSGLLSSVLMASVDEDREEYAKAVAVVERAMWANWEVVHRAKELEKLRKAGGVT